MTRRMATAALCVLWMGTSCASPNAGRTSANATPSAGSSSPSGEPAAGSGTPAWVSRGSAAVREQNRRVFYGVGSADQVKNIALLRSTADNRARNEIAKIIEVFSASLMKDYASSDGTQVVEQAVKTAASAALKGVEIVDRYAVGAQMYSLAALDLEAAMAKIREAEDLGAARSYVEKVSVDDIFDGRSKPVEPKAAVVAKQGPKDGAPNAAGAPPEKAPPPAAKAPSAPTVVEAKTKPAWVDGPDPNYSPSEVLCGVGFGRERAAAESGAYAAIARLFVSKVEAVSRDFMGSYAATGAQTLEVQESESLVRVSSEKVLAGVSIREVWAAKPDVYAIACLDRDPAARRLRESIAALDDAARTKVADAARADATAKLRTLSGALSHLLEREAQNAELRLVDPNGVGVAAELAAVDVALALESAVRALRVGVAVTGAYAEDFRTALIEGLTQRGYEVVADGDTTDLDALVSATVRLEDGGKGTGSAAQLHFARGVVQVEIQNVRANRVIGSVQDNRQEGHRSKEEAERKVVRTLGKKIVATLGGKIDAAMKGG